MRKTSTIVFGYVCCPCAKYFSFNHESSSMDKNTWIKNKTKIIIKLIKFSNLTMTTNPFYWLKAETVSSNQYTLKYNKVKPDLVKVPLSYI